MSWFNADDKMHSHPKCRRAGLEAMGLWVLAGTLCTDYLTDGLVPAWYVNSWPRGPELAQELINSGFWERSGDDWQFLSWGEYQRTKEKVLADKEAARIRMAEWRANNPKPKKGKS